ncbi:MAG: hypothetical protein ACI4QX_06105 [Lachnospiraceae bacterium]
MPHINRIRVNNVKYNFGTQAYDDFLMKPFCGNTLYDLANGGGKSVLMLLLLQNMIPNCTLDEKQPIEKLFRSGEGSKTIHSLIEWQLDDENIRNGFRYMTTGFCARKAAESEEETKDTASIEYFNYCIFYREYNANDIRNLPLVKEKERITYSGLRRYLKELERDNSLIVRVFDRKGEYQNFIADYGIYESEWEIIRGINKTEGHVRTYFETNYKTTRKVVEDLLIEEILGTSFRRKAGKEDAQDAMSKTLLDMKDKLVELAKQKGAIKNYDRQEEVLSEFSNRVAFLGSVYGEQGEAKTQLNRIYNAAQYYLNGREQAAGELKDAENAVEEELRGYEAELLSAGLSEDRELAKEYAEQVSRLLAEKEQKKEREEALSALLVRKECANDYLEYLEEKKKRDEMAVTLQAMTEQSGLQGELSALVRAYKQKKERYEEELAGALAKAESAAAGALLKYKTAESSRKDVEREAAVAEVLAEQAKRELSALYAKVKEQKDAVGLLLAEDAQKYAAECGERKLKAAAKRTALKEEAKRLTEEREEALGKVQRAEQELLRYRDHAAAREAAQERLSEEKVRADKLAEAYGEKDYRALREAVRLRCREAYAEQTRLSEQLSAAKKRRQEIEAGELFSSTEAAQTVKEYICTRHKKKAVTGAEYLQSKSGEEQEELLRNFPGLPFAVITEGFAEASEDHLLAECIPEGAVVPVLRIESLRAGKELFHREQMLLCVRDGAVLLEEKARQKELVRLARLEEEAEYGKNRLRSLIEAYEEDEEFLTGFVGRYYETMYSKKVEYGTEQEDEELLREKLREENERLSALSERLRVIPAEEEECANIIAGCEEEARSYRLITELNAQAEEKEKAIREFAAKKERLQEWKKEAKDAAEALEADCAAKNAEIERLRAQAEEVRRTWDSYAVYDTEGEPAQVSWEIGELAVQIDGKIAALHTESSSMEDKQRLLDSYVSAMNRLLRNIRARGLSVAELSELYEKNEVYETSETELARRREEAAALSAEAEQLERRVKELQEKLFRLEGKNSQAEASIAEKYGEYRPVELSGEELAAFLAKRRAQIAEKKKQAAELKEKQAALLEELSGYTVIRNEISRMFEGTDALTEDCGRLENNVRLTECYKEARERYAATARELLKRQEEFYRNRQKTMETLQVLGAQALAEEIGSSVVMPKSGRETEEVVRGIKEVIECLQLERSRIEAGLGDMETIKENFESQCLQRCLNIKADLERLPKLSKIMLDGEQIPMISLQIPYVKEEFFKERMTQYIDSVIQEVDAIPVQAERMKYIRTALSYKKLFSVIVTDMNGIRLLLYKRERIKEQSRHLRYEEAVGSTGQSQGIYIQFLIAIINYISSIYSPKGDAAGLRKVIFIDNPFGAAKDVYIWEPIFELLRANRVQLIVPARGTTPAITGRFDVNYVLGQKLIDGRQQTVVVDYCSRVEADSVEFIPLQFEQTSLDISEV